MARLTEKQERFVKEYLAGGNATDAARGETASSAPSLRGNGCREAVQKGPDIRERLKAAELIGKRYSLFTDRIAAAGAVPVVIVGEDQLED